MKAFQYKIQVEVGVPSADDRLSILSLLLRDVPHIDSPQTSTPLAKSFGMCVTSMRNILTPTPYTLHPTPYTLHPAPYTLHPTPYNLHTAPHPTTDALHPTPYTLHHTPSTLNPHPNLKAQAPTPQPQTWNPEQRQAKVQRSLELLLLLDHYQA